MIHIFRAVRHFPVFLVYYIPLDILKNYGGFKYVENSLIKSLFLPLSLTLFCLANANSLELFGTFFSFISERFLRKDAPLQLFYPKPHNNNHPCSLPRASQVAQVVKNPPANAGDARDMDLIPGSERYPGEGNGNPLQYPCLGNPMDRGVW